MNKLRYGIEKTIVGFFFLIGLSFLFWGIGRFSPKDILSSISDIDTRYIPYISIVLIAVSFLICTIIESLSYSFIVKVGPKIKNSFKKKYGKKSPKLFESVGGVINNNEFAAFLKHCSKEQFNEYNDLRSKNIIFRVMSIAMFFNIPFLFYWLIRIHMKAIVIILIELIIFILGILLAFAYFENRKVYCSFRDAVFKMFKDK